MPHMVEDRRGCGSRLRRPAMSGAPTPRQPGRRSRGADPTRRRVRGVLVVYHRFTYPGYADAANIYQHIDAFSRHSSHRVWSVNAELGFPRRPHGTGVRRCGPALLALRDGERPLPARRRVVGVPRVDPGSPDGLLPGRVHPQRSAIPDARRLPVRLRVHPAGAESVRCDVRGPHATSARSSRACLDT